jgi:hypothetical protein
VEPLPARQPSPLSPSTPPVAAPLVPVAPGLEQVPGLQPWAVRRQPQVSRRSVLPVEWFRRMPGGATTYTVPGADTVADHDQLG